jgi:hypothetical protein
LLRAQWELFYPTGGSDAISVNQDKSFVVCGLSACVAAAPSAFRLASFFALQIGVPTT